MEFILFLEKPDSAQAKQLLRKGKEKSVFGGKA